MPKLSVLKVERPRVTKTVAGVTYTQTCGGQKHAYGDSYWEFDIESCLPMPDVERICCTVIYPCALPEKQWRDEDKSAGAHFRKHYTFRKTEDRTYTYSVCSPYTD